MVAAVGVDTTIGRAAVLIVAIEPEGTNGAGPVLAGVSDGAHIVVVTGLGVESVKATIGGVTSKIIGAGVAIGAIDRVTEAIGAQAFVAHGTHVSVDALSAIQEADLTLGQSGVAGGENARALINTCVLIDGAITVVIQPVADLLDRLVAVTDSRACGRAPT
jgi:hypothetical protein